MRTQACLILLALSAGACTTPRPRAPLAPAPPIASDPTLDELGLGVGAHHLEQHPDQDCRVNWRPAALSVDHDRRSVNAEAVRETALAMQGTPYVYGGVGVRGLDCSAFVNRVYAQHGYDLPRTSREQFRVGLVVERHELAPGDLLFFVAHPGDSTIDHVALYLGGERFIHAARGKGRVTVDSLASSYYGPRLVGARRVLALPPGRYSNRGGGARAGLLFHHESDLADAFASGVGPCRELAWE